MLERYVVHLQCERSSLVREALHTFVEEARRVGSEAFARLQVVRSHHAREKGCQTWLFSERAVQTQICASKSTSTINDLDLDCARFDDPSGIPVVHLRKELNDILFSKSSLRDETAASLEQVAAEAREA